MRTAFRAGLSPRLVPPLRLSASFGLEAEGGAVGGLEGARDRDRLVVGSSRSPGRAEHVWRSRCVAGGRVEDEVGPVDVGADVASVDGDAVDDVGDRVRAGGVDEDFGGFGVDLQGLADDHGAEVEGADLGGGDRDGRELGAVVGAGEVDLAGGVGQGGADAGAGEGVADFGGGRAGGALELFLAAVVAGPGLGGGDRRVGAEGDPGRACRSAPGGSLIEKRVNSCSPSLRERRR